MVVVMPARSPFLSSLLALHAALLLGGLVGAADGNPGKAVRGRCWITFHVPCTEHPEFHGKRDDSEIAYQTMGVGDSEPNCLDRAQTYWEWCGQALSEQVSANFAPSGGETVFPPDDVAIDARGGMEGGADEDAEGAATPAETLSVGDIGSAAGGGGGAEHATESKNEATVAGWQQAVELAWHGAVRAASLGAAAASEALRQTATLASAAANTVTHWASLPGNATLYPRVEGHREGDARGGDGQRSWVAILIGGAVAIVSYMGVGAALTAVRRSVRAFFVRRIDWDTPERARVVKDPRDFRRQERLAIALDDTMAVRGKDGTLSLVPKCAEAVRALVSKFGRLNVFIVACVQTTREGEDTLAWLRTSPLLAQSQLLYDPGHIFLLDAAAGHAQVLEVVERVGISVFAGADGVLAERLAPLCDRVFLFDAALAADPPPAAPRAARTEGDALVRVKGWGGVAAGLSLPNLALVDWDAGSREGGGAGGSAGRAGAAGASADNRGGGGAQPVFSQPPTYASGRGTDGDMFTARKVQLSAPVARAS
ncbi:hypothetical protein T484DRAFT_1930731 [Baffinella frigidus]|nr:hypothetical protein T484DRAFT_1930731 [Cryptophyta sp. CCMP2293]